MDYLTQLYLPGALTVWCALLFGVLALWGYSQVLRGEEGARLFARRAYRFYTLAIVLAALVLVILLMRRDFRIEYVYQYSGLDLSWNYQFASFWAGQKGSFLIWLLWAALLGLPLMRLAGRDEAAVMGIYTLTNLGLLFILVRENPFVMLTESPADGQGLNPLLQDNWMVIHPPIMFIGYALMAVPFAIAMAALWRRDTSRWAALAFPWVLAGFIVLGSAILLGGYWAYKTLGWGGYWGWDPVENASLIPWILTITLVHGLYVERTRGRFRRVNFLLASLAYLAVLYGTFLTRSGVLADFSVHSFVDLGISGWLIALMAFFFLTAVYLMATRLRSVPTGRNEDPLLSRGSFLVLATITLSVSALVITAGTSAPLLTRFLENPGQVGPEFYNRVNQPLAIVAALLLALIPYLTWRGERFGEVARRAVVPAGVALVGAAVAVVLGVREPFHVLLVLLALLAVATNLQRVVALARKGGMRAAGGYLAHVGIGLMLVGFLSSTAYDDSTKVTLEQGKAEQVGDLSLTFIRFLPRSEGEKERMEVEVVQADGSRYLAYPKFFLNDRTRQLMVNPDIRKTLLRDVYISPLEFQPGVEAGAARTVELAPGEAQEIGGLELRFLGFAVSAEGGNAMAAMAAGQPVTVGARLAMTTGSETTELAPLYRFNPAGFVETPPLDLPGGGSVMVQAINASSGAVQLSLQGLGGAAGVPARLSLDVTTKPLIKLVWYGLYVVLIGGVIATVARVRQARRIIEESR